MLKPVKNKKCNHYYDESAILDLIKTRRNLKKKCRYETLVFWANETLKNLVPFWGYGDVLDYKVCVGGI